MNLSDNQIRALLLAVGRTRDHEMACDECLSQLGEYAELTLRGRTAQDAYDLVRHHLQGCSECCEEFTLLLKALEHLAGPPS
jgi:hypothetical protein